MTLGIDPGITGALALLDGEGQPAGARRGPAGDS